MYEAAEKAAREAGELLRSRASANKKVTYKGKINLVTEVDTLSERTIVRYLAKRFPEHSFLGEEGGTSCGAGAIGVDSPTFQWVVDPLDGTTNYVHGYRIYSVSIALRCLYPNALRLPDSAAPRHLDPGTISRSDPTARRDSATVRRLDSVAMRCPDPTALHRTDPGLNLAPRFSVSCMIQTSMSFSVR